MNKQEYIERYGEKAYLEYKEEHNKYMKQYRLAHPELREYKRLYNIKSRANKYRDTPGRTDYCYKDYEFIENYELAKADNFDPNKWHLHHRLENYWSRSKLIRKNLYINVNPESLIWLPAKEHMTDSSISIHHKERSKWHKRILEE